METHQNRAARDVSKRSRGTPRINYLSVHATQHDRTDNYADAKTMADMWGRHFIMARMSSTKTAALAPVTQVYYVDQVIRQKISYFPTKLRQNKCTKIGGPNCPSPSFGSPFFLRIPSSPRLAFPKFPEEAGALIRGFGFVNWRLIMLQEFVDNVIAVIKE